MADTDARAKLPSAVGVWTCPFATRRLVKGELERGSIS